MLVAQHHALVACVHGGIVCVSVPRLFFGYATGTNLMFPFAVGSAVGLFVEKPTAERA